MALRTARSIWEMYSKKKRPIITDSRGRRNFFCALALARKIRAIEEHYGKRVDLMELDPYLSHRENIRRLLEKYPLPSLEPQSHYIQELYWAYLQEMEREGKTFGPLVPANMELIREYKAFLKSLKRVKRRRITKRYVKEVEKTFLQLLARAKLLGYVYPGGLLRFDFPESREYRRVLRVLRRRKRRGAPAGI